MLLFFELHLMIISSDKPDMPQLTSSSTNPTDGQTLTLTCKLQNAKVNKFEFFLNKKLVGAAGTSNTYTVKSVSFTDAGGYSCRASVDTVGSETSNTVTVKGTYLKFTLYDVKGYQLYFDCNGPLGASTNII